MTLARSGIEVILPYGNANGLQHFRFHSDYETFCGRNCEGWTQSGIDVREAIESVYTCKRCLKGLFK
jgi:hypothetical protein